MSLWKKDDTAANSVFYVPAQFNKTVNVGNQAALFGNVTPDAFVTGQTVGQFGVDATEATVATGGLIQTIITSGGSGYHANATATITGNATGNAQANSTGRIGAVNITDAGSGYVSAPTITIAAPAAKTFNANTQGVDEGNDFIIVSSNKYQDNDYIKYLVTAGNTAITPLTNNTSYYVVSANSTGIKLSTTKGGTPANLVIVVADESGHSLTGQTAVAVGVVSGGRNRGIAHAGWNLRTVGSGGRAGRVQYETLVAMGSMTADNEDVVLPDS